MSLSGLIAIAENEHLLPAQLFRIFLSPFSCAHRVTRGSPTLREPEPVGCVHVFFSFEQENRLGGHNIRESIESEAGIVQIPDPAALPIGSTLTKVFWFIADDLKQEVSS